MVLGNPFLNAPRDRRQIAFVTQVVFWPRVLNLGALKTCADKLLANVTFTIFAISLIIAQHKS